jgi:hypothetical protein
MRQIIERLVARTIGFADRTAAWGHRVLKSRGLRRAWLAVACLAALPMLGMGVVQAASVLAHEEHSEVATVDATGIRRLDIDNDGGTTTVVGVDGAREITVRAHISEGMRSTGHRVYQRDGTLFVDGSCPLFASEWCAIDYAIEVPSDVYVDVFGAEAITVSDVTGGLRANSGSSVSLARVGGEVDIQSDQGRLEATDLTATRLRAYVDQGRVSLDFAESPEEVAVTADQGSVEILLPDDEGVYYATSTKADQGSVRDEINRDLRSDRSITVEADQGSITIAYTLS